VGVLDGVAAALEEGRHQQVAVERPAEAGLEGQHLGRVVAAQGRVGAAGDHERAVAGSQLVTELLIDALGLGLGQAARVGQDEEDRLGPGQLLAQLGLVPGQQHRRVVDRLDAGRVVVDGHQRARALAHGLHQPREQGRLVGLRRQAGQQLR
jgi:hypothetical protein